jgi:hypothetical protein
MKTRLLLFLASAATGFAAMTTLPPSADAHVRGGAHAGVNFGAASALELKDGANADFKRQVYLGFDLGPIQGVVTNATLRLFVASKEGGDSAIPVKAYQVANDNWTEGGITWNNRPAAGALIATANVTSAGVWYSWDVTAFVATQAAGDAAASFVLMDTDLTGLMATFHSREGANVPALDLTWTPFTNYALQPKHDAHVRDGTYQNTNYGNAALLEVKDGANSGFKRHAYLKFDLSPIAGTVHNATLRLHVASKEGATTPVPVKLHRVPDDTWVESTITWADKPAAGTLISTGNVTSADAWYAWDVTSYVNSEAAADRSASFVLLDSSQTGLKVDFTSSEGPAGQRPVLAIQLEETALAFPGAEGFGRNTVGGRGGEVVHVTNLNDTGPGSLRWALQSVSGPRYVVFDVGGVIDLTSGPIVINNPYVTIAGQTAPGEGICTRLSTIRVRTHEVIVRGMKMRAGDEFTYSSPLDANGCLPVGAPLTGSPGEAPYNRRALSTGDINNFNLVWNVVIDHNSMCWTLDTTTSVLFGSRDITYTNNLVAEALHDNIHIDEGKRCTAPHGYGVNFYSGVNRITFAKNVVSTMDSRMPMIHGVDNHGATAIEVINNFIYNWRSESTTVTSNGTGLRTAHLIGNYYKRGYESLARPPVYIKKAATGSKAYLLGNLDDLYRPAENHPEYAIAHGENNGPVHASMQSTTPVFTPSGIFALPVADLMMHVAAQAGAMPWARDAVDTRLMQNAIESAPGADGGYGRGRTVNRPGDVGGYVSIDSASRPSGYDSDGDGMPDAWEIARGLNPAANDANGRDLSPVYDNIEMYINSLFF